jgi:hypothetical protein
MVPGLEERLVKGSDEETRMIADLVGPGHHKLLYHADNLKLQKGASSARSDDTRSLKSAVLDWIVPRGEVISPPIARNVKADRGFNHEKTGALLCPAGLDWCGDGYFRSLHFSLFFLMDPCQRETEIAEW